MKTKIEVITNFNELNKDCQEKIYSDLGRSMAQTYLENLVKSNLTPACKKLRLNQSK